MPALSIKAGHHWPVIFLAALTITLGSFAAWAADKTSALRGTAAARNAALTDSARTSDVKGQVTSAVNTVFSYNYADTAKTERAAKDLLTGKAVEQYNRMFGLVRTQAPQQKQVLTTTVTESGVKMLTADRARLLIYADQRNTRTDKNKTSYSAAVFAVGAVLQDGKWKIENLDTFGS